MTGAAVNSHLPRRDFLKLTGITSAGLALSACGVNPTAIPPTAAPSATLPPTLTPAPTLTSTPQPPTLAQLARKIGMDVGIDANYLGLFAPNKQAIKFADAPQAYVQALQNFSLLTNGYEGDPAWTDYKPEVAFGFWRDFSLFCQQHDIRLDLNHMFYGLGHFDEDSPVAALVNAPKDEVIAWMKGRVKKFFELPYFSQLNFVNEVFYGNNLTDEVDWVAQQNPFYNLWGKDYVRQAYLIVYEAAQAIGRQVSGDLRLIYNAPLIEFDNRKARVEYDFLANLKEQLRQETGLDRPFDIGMQFHIRDLPLEQMEYWGTPPDKLEKQTLIAHLRKFGELGDVHITELSIFTPDKSKELDLLHTVVEAAIESGVCPNLVMWAPFTPADAPWAPQTMRHLFEGDFHNPQPGYIFDELYKILASYAANPA